MSVHNDPVELENCFAEAFQQAPNSQGPIRCPYKLSRLCLLRSRIRRDGRSGMTEATSGFRDADWRSSLQGEDECLASLTMGLWRRHLNGEDRDPQDGSDKPPPSLLH
jgi:hypothetical protein